MQIYVDESGNFMPPASPKAHMCCVSALAVPEASLTGLHDLHAQLLADWKPADGEVKGRELNEEHFERIWTALVPLNVVPVIVAIDMGLQSDPVTSAHKAGQAQKLRESVADSAFEGSFRRDVHDLAARIERLSNQQYVQFEVQTTAIARTIRVATLHYARSAPEALGAFVWRVDAKDRSIQECERLWAELVKPYLQTIFLRAPLLQIRGGPFDYSAMARFENPDRDAAPAHLRAAIPGEADQPFLSGDLGATLADLEFQDSKGSQGIQFADTTANAFCRACNSRLGPRGWERLGQLLIKHLEDRQAVSYLSLAPITSGVRPGKLEYGPVVRRIEASARTIDLGK